jgi:ATP-binding cassette subfamily B protein
MVKELYTLKLALDWTLPTGRKTQVTKISNLLIFLSAGVMLLASGSPPGDISLPPHDDKISHAARQTRADDFIQKLPRGYETVLGHEFEDQGELSQGEWQKVALARAFLRQAQLIILDEPTSWMDARAEYEVFKSFRKMFIDRMILLISHRFSTVRLADYIYVLEGGKIIEGCTHNDLIHRGGKYAQLFEMQASSYR